MALVPSHPPQPKLQQEAAASAVQRFPLLPGDFFIQSNLSEYFHSAKPVLEAHMPKL